jgi:hypothetical protein
MSKVCNHDLPKVIPPPSQAGDFQNTPLSTADELADERFFHLTMAAVSSLFLVVSVRGCSLLEITLLPGPVMVRAGLIAGLFALAFFYRWRRAQRMVNVLVIVAWSVLFSALYSVPQYMAGRSSAALCDQWLARMDRSLGIEVPNIVAFIAGYPGLGRFLALSYDALLPMIALAIILPAFCGAMQRAKEYCIACLASAAIGIPLFAFLPALGPWTHYGYPASPEQASYLQVLQELRSPGSCTLDLGHVEGIITFPSFHTALAIMAAFALWPLRYVRWPAAVLAVLISLSTLTTGWHYVADVLAGVVLAASSCAIAKGYTCAECRWRQKS